MTRDAKEEPVESLEPAEFEKWIFLRDVPYRDSRQPEMRAIATLLSGVASQTRWSVWTFAQLAHALVRDCIIYQKDDERVGREQIDGWRPDPYVSPLVPLNRGFDDCDAKARMFVALCLANHLKSEMVPRCKGGKLVHVYARVLAQAPTDTEEKWHLVECILRRARIGEIAEHVPKEPETGSWEF
jgi:hypothetical protein